MKRLVMFVVLVMGLAFVRDVSAMELGLKAGVNFSAKMSPMLREIAEMGQRDFYFGGFVSLPISKGVMIQPEVIFSKREVVAGTDDIGFLEIYLLDKYYKRVLNVNYIEMPCLFKIVPLGGAVSPYLLAGPYVGFKFSKELEQFDGQFNERDFPKGCDVGGVLGGGISWKQGKGSLLLEIRYSLGLNRASKASFGDKIQTLGVLMGYAF